MTSLEAVEAYSSHHAETFEELLEWPYRRFIKAFGAWQRRNAVDEIEKKKNMHVQAMWCVSTDIKILTKRGFLKYDEIEIGDETIGWNPDTSFSEWTEITDINYFDNAETAEISNSRWSVRATLNHRWLTRQKLASEYGWGFREENFRTIEEFNNQTYIICSEEFYGSDGLDITDDEAEIIGWVVGDGCVVRSPKNASGETNRFRLAIYQSKPEEVEHLDRLIGGITKKRKVRRKGSSDRGFNSNYDQYSWEFDTEDSVDLWSRSGLKIDKREKIIDFVLSLNHGQLERFMDGIFRAEGTETEYEKRINQNIGEIADAIEIGIYLLGYKPSRRLMTGNENHCGISYIRPRMRTSALKVTNYKEEPVWCPTTSLGSWTAKNSNSLFLTGNSIVEWKESSDQKEAIEDIEKYYELLKDIVWDPAKMDRENKEMQEIEETDPFLKAGKRNLKKVVEPYMPNQKSIEDTLNE